MKLIKFSVILIASIVLLTGCATVTMLNSAYPAKSRDAKIDVYVTAKPNCEYMEIAIIKGDNFLSERGTLTQIKVKAREVGADAIIVIGSASVSTLGVPIGNNITHYSTENSGVKAVAIKYKNN